MTTSTAAAWHLGRWSKPVGWIAVGWVALADVLFCLPVVRPVFTWGVHEQQGTTAQV